MSGIARNLLSTHIPNLLLMILYSKNSLPEAVEKRDEVAKIIEEINQIDINKIELDPKTDEFLKTVEAYLNCLDTLQALYEKVDPNHKLANHDMDDIKNPIQQLSLTGEPVKNIAELYEAAEIMLPVFEAKIKSLLEQVTSSSPEVEGSSGGVKFKLAPLKGMQRASEKAQDDYSKNVPGPPVSWLYDIVRGSLLFDDAEKLLRFLELVRADESIVIVKSKNRFRKPTLSGYRDFNLQIQITNPENGMKHICELQLHIKAIKEADTVLGSHDFYEFFRKYYAGATDTLKERMEDLRVICKGGSLDMTFLANVIENPLEVDHMKRLVRLFKDFMNEYQIAIMITNAIRDSLKPGDWYDRTGVLLRRQGKLEEAIVMHQESLDIQLETLGPNNANNAMASNIASSYSNIGLVLEHQGKLEEALKHYKLALDLKLNALGRDHADTALTYNNMAGVLQTQGKSEEAMKLYKTALDIQLKVLGPDHADTANTYNNMAIVLRYQDKLEDALKLYETTLDIRMKALGPDHADTALTYNNMAIVLRNQGKLEEALKLYNMALDIQLKALGPDHADTAVTYNNMAGVLFNQDKLKEAMKLYKEALDIRLKTLGMDHHDTAHTYVGMANVLDVQGEMEEAMELYKHALDIRLKTFGPEHATTADTYYNMANMVQNQDKLEEALELFQKAHDIYVKVYGPDHSETEDCHGRIKNIQDRLLKRPADAKTDMALFLQEMGELEEAMNLYNQALDILLKIRGPDHADTANTYNNMAIVLDIQGELEEAMKLYQKALDIRLKALGPDHVDTAVTYYNMAIALQNQGKLEEALKRKQQALKIYVKAFGPDHARTAVIYNGIGNSLSIQNRLDEALVECQKELDIQVRTLGEYDSATAHTMHSIGEILCKQGKLEEATMFGEKALEVFLDFHGPDHPYTAEGRKLMDMIHEKSSET